MELSVIQHKIHEIRGMRVLLDYDLAAMYGVETRRLNEAVKRNINRFPVDFMFELSQNEWDNLMSQSATSSWGGMRKLPKAFTEQGVAMLSSVLTSKQAIDININIMRAFVAVRGYLSQYANTSQEISALWQQLRLLEERSEQNLKAINDLSEGNEEALDDIYIALTELAKKQTNSQAPTPRKAVGYIQPPTCDTLCDK